MSCLCSASCMPDAAGLWEVLVQLSISQDSFTLYVQYKLKGNISYLLTGSRMGASAENLMWNQAFSQPTVYHTSHDCAQGYKSGLAELYALVDNEEKPSGTTFLISWPCQPIHLSYLWILYVQDAQMLLSKIQLSLCHEEQKGGFQLEGEVLLLADTAERCLDITCLCFLFSRDIQQ